MDLAKGLYYHCFDDDHRDHAVMISRTFCLFNISEKNNDDDYDIDHGDDDKILPVQYR